MLYESVCKKYFEDIGFDQGFTAYEKGVRRRFISGSREEYRYQDLDDNATASSRTMWNSSSSERGTCGLVMEMLLSLNSCVSQIYSGKPSVEVKVIRRNELIKLTLTDTLDSDRTKTTLDIYGI